MISLLQMFFLRNWYPKKKKKITIFILGTRFGTEPLLLKVTLLQSLILNEEFLYSVLNFSNSVLSRRLRHGSSVPC